MTILRIESIKCDGVDCDHVREKDANHWLVGMQHGQFMIIARNRGEFPNIVFRDLTIDERPDVQDFCGEECAIKWVSKMLTEIKK